MSVRALFVFGLALLAATVRVQAQDSAPGEPTAAFSLSSSQIFTTKDSPAIDLNAEVMKKFNPELRKYYFDPTRYKTYLEQLGISYPTVRQAGQKSTAQ